MGFEDGMTISRAKFVAKGKKHQNKLAGLAGKNRPLLTPLFDGERNIRHAFQLRLHAEAGVGFKPTRCGGGPREDAFRKDLRKHLIKN